MRRINIYAITTYPSRGLQQHHFLTSELRNHKSIDPTPILLQLNAHKANRHQASHLSNQAGRPRFPEKTIYNRHDEALPPIQNVGRTSHLLQRTLQSPRNPRSIRTCTARPPRQSRRRLPLPHRLHGLFRGNGHTTSLHRLSRRRRHRRSNRHVCNAVRSRRPRDGRDLV